MCLIKIILVSWSEIYTFFTHNRSTNHKSPCHFIHPSLTPYGLRISNSSLGQTHTLSAAVGDRRSEKERDNHSCYICSKSLEFRSVPDYCLPSPSNLNFFFLNLCVNWGEGTRLWKKLFPLLDVFSQWTPSCLQISEGWVSGGWGQALFSGAQWQDKG